MTNENVETIDEIFVRTRLGYFDLVNVDPVEGKKRKDIASVLSIAPSVPDEIVERMLSGISWRERLLGLCIAMSMREQPPAYAERMTQSLGDPRCFAIVPTAAALALLAGRGTFTMTNSFGEQFDQNAFSGEIAWAVRKAMFYANLCSEDAAGHAPNNGQIFEDHLQFYESIRPS